MLPDKVPSSLQESDVVAELLPKAVAILQNDFQLSNIDCSLENFQGDVFQLRGTLIPVVEKTGGPGSEAFYRLLYRVDIPESKVAEVLSTDDGRPVMEKISELLIIRALQKAWYRAKFG